VVISKDDVYRRQEWPELEEPVAIRAHGSRCARVKDPLIADSVVV
jgi:hypothetical protein